MGIKNAGKNSFTWLGPKPVVNIMEPELIRDVLLKHNVFQKPPPHPLGKLLATGVVALEGEQWTKRRKIINPAFHLEKLKVILSCLFSHSFFMFNFRNCESRINTLKDGYG